MADNTPVNTRKRLLRWLLICFVVLTVGSLATFLSTPYIAKYYLKNWLVENGADSASVKKISFNPFVGRLSLQGLDIIKEDKTVVSNSVLSIDIGLRSLFSKEARVEKAIFKDIILDIEKAEDNSIRIGSYGYTPTEKVSPDPPEKEAGIDWTFLADRAELENITIRYRQPDLDIELVIDQATVERFNTIEGDDSGSLNMSGSLNGSPLTLEMSTFNILPTVIIKGNLAYSGFDLNNLARFLEPYLNPFNGISDAEGSFSITLSDDQPIAVTYNGSIKIQESEIGAESWQTAGSVDWNGEVIYSSQAEQGIDISIDGLLSGKQMSFGMERQQLQIGEPELSIDGKTTVKITDSVNVSSDATLSRKNSTFTLDTISLSTGVSSYSGTITYDSGHNTEPMSVVSDGEFRFGDIVYDQKELLTINQKELSSAGKTNLLLSDNLKVTYQGDITLAGSELNNSQINVSTDQLSWSGKTGFETTAGQPPNLILNGSLNTQSLQLALVEKDIGIRQEELTASFDSSLTLDQTVGYTGNSSLQATTLTITEKNNDLLSIGEITTGNLGELNDRGIALESLSLNTVNLPPSATQSYDISIDTVVLSEATSADLKTFSAARLEVKKPKVTDPASGKTLADVSSATANTIAIDKDLTVSVQELLISESTFLTDNSGDTGQSAITLGNASVSPISWSSANGTVIDSISLKDLFTTYAKEKTDPAEKTDQGATPETSAAAKQARAIPLRIKMIQVGGKSGLTFTDNSLPQPFSAQLLFDSIDIKDIDLNDTENIISYTLKGSVDQYATLDIDGTIAPRATPFAFKKTTKLHNYPIQNLSPYVIKTIGSAFKNGQLDISSEMSITDQKIQSDSKLNLKEIEIAAQDEERAAEFDSQLPIPLNTALGILKNKENDVHLSVSIDGELSDLDVDVSGIIVTAISKAITAGLAPYLAYTMLGPTGAIAYLGVSLGQSLLKTNFPALEYEPGVTALTDDQKVTLNKVGEKIASKYADNDEISYSICPKVQKNEITSGGSEEEQGKALYKLGDTRVAAVKAYLIENFEIEEKRLLSCNPGVDFDKDTKGSVEFRE